MVPLRRPSECAAARSERSVISCLLFSVQHSIQQPLHVFVESYPAPRKRSSCNFAWRSSVYESACKRARATERKWETDLEICNGRSSRSSVCAHETDQRTSVCVNARRQAACRGEGETERQSIEEGARAFIIAALPNGSHLFALCMCSFVIS
jgi:hypothetical protein